MEEKYFPQSPFVEKTKAAIKEQNITKLYDLFSDYGTEQEWKSQANTLISSLSETGLILSAKNGWREGVQFYMRLGADRTALTQDKKNAEGYVLSSLNTDLQVYWSKVEQGQDEQEILATAQLTKTLQQQFQAKKQLEEKKEPQMPVTIPVVKTLQQQREELTKKAAEEKELQNQRIDLMTRSKNASLTPEQARRLLIISILDEDVAGVQEAIAQKVDLNAKIHADDSRFQDTWSMHILHFAINHVRGYYPHLPVKADALKIVNILIAAIKKHPDCDRILNQRAEYGETPLHFAAYMQLNDIMHKLIAAGADASVISTEYDNVWNVASGSNYVVFSQQSKSNSVQKGKGYPYEELIGERHETAKTLREILGKDFQSITRDIAEQAALVARNVDALKKELADANEKKLQAELERLQLKDQLAQRNQEYAEAEQRKSAIELELETNKTLTEAQRKELQEELQTLEEKLKTTEQERYALQQKLTTNEERIQACVEAITKAEQNIIAKEQENTSLYQTIQQHNQPLITAIREGNIEGVRSALANNAQADIQDLKGNNVLQLAMLGALNTHQENPEKLLADVAAPYSEIVTKVLFTQDLIHRVVNSQNNETSTALHLAVQHSAFQFLAEWLIKEGKADVNLPDQYGWTALHHAVATGNTAMVQLCCENEADRGIATKKDVSLNGKLIPAGTLARDIVKGIENEEAKKSIQELLSAELSKELITYITSGANDKVKELIDQGANVNYQDEYGWTPLHYAVLANTSKITMYLLTQGADVTLKSTADYHIDTGVHKERSIESDTTASVVAHFLGYEKLGEAITNYANTSRLSEGVRGVVQKNRKTQNTSDAQQRMKTLKQQEERDRHDSEKAIRAIVTQSGSKGRIASPSNSSNPIASIYHGLFDQTQNAQTIAQDIMQYAIDGMHPYGFSGQVQEEIALETLAPVCVGGKLNPRKQQQLEKAITEGLLSANILQDITEAQLLSVQHTFAKYLQSFLRYQAKRNEAVHVSYDQTGFQKKYPKEQLEKLSVTGKKLFASDVTIEPVFTSMERKEHYATAEKTAALAVQYLTEGASISDTLQSHDNDIFSKQETITLGKVCTRSEFKKTEKLQLLITQKLLVQPATIRALQQHPTHVEFIAYEIAVALRGGRTASCESPYQLTRGDVKANQAYIQKDNTWKRWRGRQRGFTMHFKNTNVAQDIDETIAKAVRSIQRFDAAESGIFIFTQQHEKAAAQHLGHNGEFIADIIEKAVANYATQNGLDQKECRVINSVILAIERHIVSLLAKHNRTIYQLSAEQQQWLKLQLMENIAASFVPTEVHQGTITNLSIADENLQIFLDNVIGNRLLEPKAKQDLILAACEKVERSTLCYEIATAVITAAFNGTNMPRNPWDDSGTKLCRISPDLLQDLRNKLANNNTLIEQIRYLEKNPVPQQENPKERVITALTTALAGALKEGRGRVPYCYVDQELYTPHVMSVLNNGALLSPEVARQCGITDILQKLQQTETMQIQGKKSPVPESDKKQLVAMLREQLAVNEKNFRSAYAQVDTPTLQPHIDRLRDYGTRLVATYYQGNEYAFAHDYVQERKSGHNTKTIDLAQLYADGVLHQDKLSETQQRELAALAGVAYGNNNNGPVDPTVEVNRAVTFTVRNLPTFNIPLFSMQNRKDAFDITTLVQTAWQMTTVTMDIPDGSRLSQPNIFQGAKFSELVLRGTLCKTNLKFGIFRKTDLRSLQATGNDMTGIYLAEAILYEAVFGGKDCASNMENAVLWKAQAENANFQYVNLRGANLQGANLKGADFTNTDLRRADLTGANLEGAIGLQTAKLAGAKLDNVQGIHPKGLAELQRNTRIAVEAEMSQ